MKILVTGADGFIGKNLCIRLNNEKDLKVLKFTKGDPIDNLSSHISKADMVIHLAGENRPEDPNLFKEINLGLTEDLCRILKDTKSKIPVIFSSSIQATEDNLYGKSKLAAEGALEDLSKNNGNTIIVYRLPGVFGKWCKPDYNSVVATFCKNIANDLPIKINNPDTLIKLVYIDDVIESFLETLRNLTYKNIVRIEVCPEYEIILQDLADKILNFKNSRKSLTASRVGKGLERALYATYLSYLPHDKFYYEVPTHGDERGVFVEMLKTFDSGQFSFFTAHPGITRGGHYHHTKNEKFLVINGKALFKFRNIITNEIVTIETSEQSPTIVETIPGWAHDITNIGESEMFVLLWANEVFDHQHPDTIAIEV
jgi:UDP-2-acetamido-2,6-beta-L-arabino-hexul-4-ose reductase